MTEQVLIEESLLMQQQQPESMMGNLVVKPLNAMDDEREDGERSAEVTVATFEDESDNLSVYSATSDDDERRRVSFGPIHVREFERIVGDHPDVKVGVPLGIWWGYHERHPVSIDKYEADKHRKDNLRMSSITRKNLLHNVFGIPEEELRAAEKEVAKIRKERSQTNKTVETKNKVNSKLKKFKKLVKKALTAESLMKGITAAASAGMVMPVSR